MEFHNGGRRRYNARKSFVSIFSLCSAFLFNVPFHYKILHSSQISLAIIEVKVSVQGERNRAVQKGGVSFCWENQPSETTTSLLLGKIMPISAAHCAMARCCWPSSWKGPKKIKEIIIIIIYYADYHCQKNIYIQKEICISLLAFYTHNWTSQNGERRYLWRMRTKPLPVGYLREEDLVQFIIGFDFISMESPTSAISFLPWK